MWCVQMQLQPARSCAPLGRPAANCPKAVCSAGQLAPPTLHYYYRENAQSFGALLVFAEHRCELVGDQGRGCVKKALGGSAKHLMRCPPAGHLRQSLPALESALCTPLRPCVQVLWGVTARVPAQALQYALPDD